jgi:quinol monooxygenase YgiN
MSDSLKVVALIPTKPEAAEAIRAGLTELVAATRTEEGCIAYDAAESAATPGLWITTEEWRDQAALDAHMTTPHLAKAFETLGASLAGDLAIHPLQSGV